MEITLKELKKKQEDAHTCWASLVDYYQAVCYEYQLKKYGNPKNVTEELEMQTRAENNAWRRKEVKEAELRMEQLDRAVIAFSIEEKRLEDK